jgi:hypothetical protein
MTSYIGCSAFGCIGYVGLGGLRGGRLDSMLDRSICWPLACLLRYKLCHGPLCLLSGSTVDAMNILINASMLGQVESMTCMTFLMSRSRAVTPVVIKIGAFADRKANLGSLLMMAACVALGHDAKLQVEVRSSALELDGVYAKNGGYLPLNIVGSTRCWPNAYRQIFGSAWQKSSGRRASWPIHGIAARKFNLSLHTPSLRKSIVPTTHPEPPYP